MKKPKMNKVSLFVYLWFTSSLLFAQQFTAKARLTSIKNNGLHAIALTPQIRSCSKSNLSDLRLFDSKDKEIPFYIWQETHEYATHNFKEFPIVSKQILPHKTSVWVIENSEGQVIDELVLRVANSKLTKMCAISGSNDQKQWFGLLDNHFLGNLESTTSTDAFVQIHLPLSKYTYYKLELSDTLSAPINLLKIGGFHEMSFRNQLIKLHNKQMQIETKISERKITQVVISFQGPQMLDQMDFKITEPNFYKRKARILVNKTAEGKRNNLEHYQETLLEFELNSASSNRFYLPSYFEKELIIEIDNEDNPALEIAQINFSQLPAFIVADLKLGEKYTLKTGDSSLRAPKYDLENFKINSLASLPLATVSALEILQIKPTSPKNNSFWQKNSFMWICIVITLVIIVYFSSLILKDLPANKS